MGSLPQGWSTSPPGTELPAGWSTTLPSQPPTPPNSVVGGAFRRTGDLLKGMVAPPSNILEALGGPFGKMVIGAAKSGKEALGQFSDQFDEAGKVKGDPVIKGLSYARALGTGLSAFNPLASGSVTNINQLEDQGRGREAAGQSIPDILGLIAGTKQGSEAIGKTGGYIRSKAIGDPDVAALKGLQVPVKSPKILKTLQNVEGARPYFQGVKNVEEAQARVSPIKEEIWTPYKQTIDAIGDKPVKGPDGMTTVRGLEDERQQLSALNRALKQRSPEAIQLAQQKGLTQAQLLAKQRAVEAALDPELEKTGIKPKVIRKTFGQISQIGERLSGKSTILEEKQPYGLGKIVRPITRVPVPGEGRMEFSGPIKQIGGGMRDLAAGRPLWSGKPTDISLREGFRSAGAKPDLGEFRVTGNPPPPRGLLPAPAREMPAPEYNGRVEGYRPPPVDAATTAIRKGRLLPANVPERDLPMSSYHEQFPDQLPGGRRMETLTTHDVAEARRTMGAKEFREWLIRQGIR